MKKYLLLLYSIVFFNCFAVDNLSVSRYLATDSASVEPILTDRQMSNAERMLERVRKIVIIDSITVDKNRLLSAFRLPRSAGRFLTPEKISELTGYKNRNMGTGYANESGETVLWSQPDSLGKQRIVEAVKLIDGSWSEPMWSSTVLNGKIEENDSLSRGNAAYPFLLDNGLTLYYASDNDDSIGGYDIFLATRDSATGDYLQPQNMGMPFNSPYDDYMMAIDEENGIGWWVTDRNRIPGKLTVYVYRISDGRENIGADEDAVSAARIDNYRASWTDENREEISMLLKTIRDLDPDPFRKDDFYLQIPGGGHYRTWKDFKNSEAAAEMKKYVRMKNTLEKKETELRELRKKYASGPSDSLGGKIESLEEETGQMAIRLKKQLSEIYKLEFSEKL